MKKVIGKLKRLIPSKRRLIQLYAALLFNANLKGFAKGRIYQGKVKNVCTPGLNCYSCPGASGACPLGALQNSLSASGKTAPFYVFGIILLYGIIFGRFICGFLCPFGLIQDLLHKIPTPKLRKNRLTKALSYLKYVILVFFVFVIPLVYMFKDFPLPGFCKYICPAGTLGGAVSLLINPQNSEMFGMLGPLFTWKFMLMVSFAVACIFIYRCFCRFFCPLGALYGLLNRFAILGIKLDKPSCTECGRCVTKCKMDISRVGDHECINCGECISVCPTGAIQWRGGSIILPKSEIPSDASPEEKEIIEKKRSKKKLIIQITSAVLMIATLASALVYYNFFDKIPEVSAPTATVGELGIGDAVPSGALDKIGASERVDIYSDKLDGVTVLAFIDPADKSASVLGVLDECLGRDGAPNVVAVFCNTDEKGAMAYIMQSGLSQFGSFNFTLDTSGEYYKKIDKEQKPGAVYVLTGSRVISAILRDALTADAVMDAARLANTDAKPGYTVGDLCYGLDLEYVNGYGDGALNVNELRGKTVVINFWGTWCGPCKEELPHFSELASEYKDRGVLIVTVHTSRTLSEAPKYIAENFPGSDMIFVHDTEEESYFNMLRLGDSYPATLVIDERGVITERFIGKISKDELRGALDKALSYSGKNE